MVLFRFLEVVDGLLTFFGFLGLIYRPYPRADTKQCFQNVESSSAQ